MLFVGPSMSVCRAQVPLHRLPQVRPLFGSQGLHLLSLNRAARWRAISVMPGRYRGFFKVPEVTTSYTIHGGLCPTQYVLKTVVCQPSKGEKQTYAEVVQYADWLCTMTAGGQRRNYPHRKSELWARLQQEITAKQKRKKQDSLDPFGAAALSDDDDKHDTSKKKGSNKRKREHERIDQLEGLRVMVPGPTEDQVSIRFLDNGEDSNKALWIHVEDMSMFVRLLGKEWKASQAASYAFEEDLGHIRYLLGSNRYIVRWKKEDGSIDEVSVKVDNRKRRGKVFVGKVDKDEFIERKRKARESVIQKAMRQGCNLRLEEAPQTDLASEEPPQEKDATCN